MVMGQVDEGNSLAAGRLSGSLLPVARDLVPRF
jgi:hypothetical protein